ncbi:MAG TPA: alpha/beta hydrolase [Flavobacteriaceae bacterium]|nr:alpha/beta hydrolase [Flavobacteriaceae bacterium]
MKIRQAILFFILTISLFFVSCNSDENFIDQGYTTTQEMRIDVSYGEHPLQTYDLFLPAGRSQDSTKIIMLIHGGGWIDGDKTDMQDIFDLLRLKHPNHAIVNVNYVLANSQTPAFPNQFLDIATIIEKLTYESSLLHINPTFGIIGASAGAHIGLMYDYVYDLTDQVKFVASVVGPTDFTDPFYADNPEFELLLDFLVDTDAYADDVDLAIAISPAFQVSETSSPTTMFYGNQDPLVPINNAYTLRSALNTFDVENSLSVFNGGHGDDWSELEIASMQSKISQYINTYLAIEATEE